MRSMPSSSSVETLLEKDFKPTRTIVLAVGFDEEATGMQVNNATLSGSATRCAILTVLTGWWKSVPSIVEKVWRRLLRAPRGRG